MRPVDPRRSGAHRQRPRRAPPRVPDLATMAATLARKLAAGPTEHVEQCALAYWVRSHQTKYPALESFTTVPNAEQSKAQAGKKWAEGVSAGYPDHLLDVACGGYHGLRIEMKRRGDWNDRTGAPYARGEPRPEQRAWHSRLAGRGYCVWVAWGWEAARDVLLWYLALRPDGREHLAPGTHINRTRHIVL